jgi:hypothetical protein
MEEQTAPRRCWWIRGKAEGREEEEEEKKRKKEKKREKREKKTANDGPPRPKGRVPSSELVKLVIVVLVSLSNDLLRVYLV